MIDLSDSELLLIITWGAADTRAEARTLLDRLKAQRIAQVNFNRALARARDNHLSRVQAQVAKVKNVTVIAQGQAQARKLLAGFGVKGRGRE